MNAQSHGWSLERIDICEIVSAEAQLKNQQSILCPSAVELGKTIEMITGCITRINPSRVVTNSTSVICLFAGESARYRQQLLRRNDSCRTMIWLSCCLMN